MVIHSQEFGRVKLFVTANVNKAGEIKEVFITCDQPGAVLDGFCDAWATCLSMLLQWGESVETVAAKFGGMEFEPKGKTDNPKIAWARSVPDYVVRWMVQNEL